MILKDVMDLIDKNTYICITTMNNDGFVTLAMNHNATRNAIDTKGEFYVKWAPWKTCDVVSISCHGVLTIEINRNNAEGF